VSGTSGFGCKSRTHGSGSEILGRRKNSANHGFRMQIRYEFFLRPEFCLELRSIMSSRLAFLIAAVQNQENRALGCLDDAVGHAAERDAQRCAAAA